MTGRAIEAVIFDWGGTLTAWHDIDFHAESMALAQAVVGADHPVEVSQQRLHRAGSAVWGRSRDHQRSSTVDDLFREAGLDHDPDLLAGYYAFWEPHTRTDSGVGALWEASHEREIAVGVLSNTLWPRAVHEQIFERDGVRHLIDGDVYSSEIPWTKPSPGAFAAAMDAVGATDPTRCVYVGDRLFDDVWGARNAGLRAIHVPHSSIPAEQVGHSVGVPDAVAPRIGDVLEIVAAWA